MKQLLAVLLLCVSVTLHSMEELGLAGNAFDNAEILSFIKNKRVDKIKLLCTRVKASKPEDQKNFFSTAGFANIVEVLTKKIKKDDKADQQMIMSSQCCGTAVGVIGGCFLIAAGLIMLPSDHSDKSYLLLTTGMGLVGTPFFQLAASVSGYTFCRHTTHQKMLDALIELKELPAYPNNDR